MSNKQILHLFWENKIGGAEMIGKREAFDGNTQLFFIKSDRGNLRISELLQLLRNRDYSCIITSLWKAHLCFLVISFFIPHNYVWVVFIHSTKFFHHVDRIITRVALLKANLVIADGSKSQLFISNYTSLPIEVYRMSLKNLAIVPWNFHSSLKYSFLFVGRIVSYKRIDRIVELAKIFSAKSLAYSITIAGPIEREPNIDMSVLNSHGINYVGVVTDNDDKAGLYECNNFLINLSDVEGLGLSVVEGICNGLIPIVTKVGEMPNYCLEPHSIVWDPGEDIDALVNSIINFDLLIQHSSSNFRNLENYMSQKGTLLSEILKKHCI